MMDFCDFFSSGMWSRLYALFSAALNMIGMIRDLSRTDKEGIWW